MTEEGVMDTYKIKSDVSSDREDEKPANVPCFSCGIIIPHQNKQASGHFETRRCQKKRR